MTPNEEQYFFDLATKVMAKRATPEEVREFETLLMQSADHRERFEVFKSDVVLVRYILSQVEAAEAKETGLSEPQLSRLKDEVSRLAAETKWKRAKRITQLISFSVGLLMLVVVAICIYVSTKTDTLNGELRKRHGREKSETRISSAMGLDAYSSSNGWQFDPGYEQLSQQFDLGAIHGMLGWPYWSDDDKQYFKWNLDSCTSRLLHPSTTLFPVKLDFIILETERTETHGAFKIKLELIKFPDSLKGQKENMHFQYATAPGRKGFYYLRDRRVEELFRSDLSPASSVSPLPFERGIEIGETSTSLLCVWEFDYPMLRMRQGYLENAAMCLDYNIINPIEWLGPHQAGIDTDIAIGTPIGNLTGVEAFQFGTNAPPFFSKGDAFQKADIGPTLDSSIRAEIASAVNAAEGAGLLTNLFTDPAVRQALDWLKRPESAGTNIVWAHHRFTSLASSSLLVAHGLPNDKESPEMIAEMRRKEIEREFELITNQVQVEASTNGFSLTPTNKILASDNPGLLVISDHRIVDMRGWTNIQNHDHPLSKVTLIRTLELRKIVPTDTYVVEAHTSGLRVVMSCLESLPYRCVSEEERSYIGDKLELKEQMIINISSLTNQEFTLHLIFTYENERQPDPEPDWGIIGYTNSGYPSMLIIFPSAMPFKDYSLHVVPKGSTNLTEFNGPRSVITSPKHEWLNWEVAHPQSGELYKVKWHFGNSVSSQ